MSYQPDESGLAETGALVVMLLAGLGLAILAFMLMTTVAGAVECKERPDGRSYWTYRIIDGDRCWTRGRRHWPKSRLYWPDKPKEIKSDPIVDKIRAEAIDEPSLDSVTWHMARPFDEAQPLFPPLAYNPADLPDECCWPNLSEFDRRFTGIKP